MPLQEESLVQTVVPFIGLKNKGNTCFLNSILQVLYYCPSFIQELFKLSSAIVKIDKDCCKEVKDENRESFSLIKELKSVFSSLDKNQSRLLNERNSLNNDEIKSLSAVCPQTFINCLRKLYPAFEPYTQQDAQECFHCILNICNSVVLLLNENLKKSFDLTSYVPSESKVVGGRRSSPISVLKSQNKQNVATSSNSLSNSNASNALPSAQNKTPLNSCNSSLKSDKNKSFSPKKPTPSSEKNTLSLGCLKGLKRKHDMANTNLSTVQCFKDDLFDSQSEKENRVSLTMHNDSSTEPVEKKRRLDSSFQISSPKQPSLLKSLWKMKPKVLSTKNLSKLGEKLAGFYANRIIEKPGKAEVKSVMVTPVKCKVKKSSVAAELLIVKSVVASDFIKEMFQGKLVTTVKCTECENEVHRYETFQDVSLPVKNIPSNMCTDQLHDNADESLSLAKPIETCSLLWALDHFASTETLCGDNKYFCSSCMRLCEGEQKMRFKQLPPIFALHLKRFSAASNPTAFTSVSKITSALEIPSTMKFTTWCSADCEQKNAEYELFGIVIHSGLSITGGHYLSYVKYNARKTVDHESLRSYNGQWLEFDDEQVRFLSEEEMQKALNRGDFNIPTKSAYMLFYHRSSLG